MTPTPPSSPADKAAVLLVDELVDSLRMSRRAAQAFTDRVLPAVLRKAGEPVEYTADPDQPCPHLDFHLNMHVARVGDGDPTSGRIKSFVAEITTSCSQCGEPFRFMGVPAGYSFSAPSVSIDERTVNLPMRPASSDPDFGLGIPGFAINVYEAPPPGSGAQP